MMPSDLITIGWWSPSGAGRLEIPRDREGAVRRRLYEQGAVVWREGIPAAAAGR